MRSWLIIEADSQSKLTKAPLVGADAIVVDLASIPADDGAEAMRDEIAAWLKTYSDPLVANKAFARWVRIKPLDGPLWREDLMAVMKGAPDGVILPKTGGPQQVRQLASELYEVEQKLGLKHNSTKIMPQIGETPHAALTLSELTQDPQPRLTGFTWNAQGLAERLGAKRTQDENGRWTDVMRHVRANVILLAKSMGVTPIETPTIDAADEERGGIDARAAREDGFTGMCATHPRQVAAINDAFSLSSSERAEADAMINLFAAEKAAMAAAKEVKEPEVPEEDAAQSQLQKLRAIG